MNVMLLAAGEGTRLRPYTLQAPKPSIPFLTIPLAAHSLNFIHGQAINKLVVNTFHLPAKVHRLFHTLPHGAQNLHFSDEVGEILGNGGGLGKAKDHFLGGGDFIMMNSDEVILPENPHVLAEALELHKKKNALATLVVMDYPGVGSQFGGVWCKKTGQVLGFGKSPVAGAERAWHFIGVQILSEEIFKFIPQHKASNILYDAVAAGMQQGHYVQVLPISASWYETGNPGDFFQASEQCFKFLNSTQDSYQKKFLRHTLERFAPEGFEVQNFGSSQRVVSSTAKISPKARLQGLITVSAGGEISDGCVLKNVVVGNNISVPAGTEIQNSMFL